MLTLKELLSNLDPQGTSTVELMSGRRARVLRGADMRNIGDEALTDEDVLEMCGQCGARDRLDNLDSSPVSWVWNSPRGLVRISVALRGREVVASFVATKPAKPNPSRELRSEHRDHIRRPSRAAIKRPSRELERAPHEPHEARAAAHESPKAPHAGVTIKRGRTEPPPAARQDAPPRRRSSAPRPAVRPPAPPPALPQEALQAPNPLATRAATGHGAAEAATRQATVREPPMQLRREPSPSEREPQRAETAPAVPSARVKQPPPTPEPEPPKEDFEIEVDFAVSVSSPAPPAPEPPKPRAARRHTADHLVNLVLEALELGASDLHLVAKTPPEARGPRGLVALDRGRPLDPAEMDAIFKRLVPAAKLATLDRSGGSCTALTLDEADGVRLRVNATVTLAGPKLAIRVLPPPSPSADHYGLPKEFAPLGQLTQGLVLVSGPSGQGKTTTLACLVEAINATRSAHILVVEDPVEILLPSKRAIVSQREVGTHTTSFARALKGALRQDPDIIVIGELRDAETVRIALSASETGHLVLGTMNTPTMRAAIDRMIDLFPPADQSQVRATLAGALRAVTGQRLVPRADGKGRVAAFELLPGSVALSSLIRDEKMYQIPSLLQRGRGAGILRLGEALAELVSAGTITQEDALLATPEKAELLAALEPQKTSLPRQPTSPQGEAPPLAPAVPAPPESALGALFSKAGAFLNKRGGT
ncbi:MAG: PilT/PilU family type 4a pilus ATPase [Polyangiaceae bacterium]